MQDEKGNNSADDGSREGTAQNGEKDIIPAKRESLIGVIEIIGGIIFAGIVVALSDAGFHICGFLFGFLSVGCGLVILTHLVEKLGFKYGKTLLWTLVISDFILFTFLAWHTFSVEKSSEPKAHPLTFRLRMGDSTLSDRAQLTNDFLFFTDDDKIHKILGYLFVPIQADQSNAEFKFSIKNNSAIMADNIEISINVPKSAQCIPDPRWSRVEANRLFSTSEKRGALETNEMETFAFFAPHGLLPEDGGEFPGIKLNRLPFPIGIAIIARAKDFSDVAINFSLIFMTNSIFETNDFHKPFVLLKTNFNKMPFSPDFIEMPFSPETLKELQK
jgi:hypothetical protein